MTAIIISTAIGTLVGGIITFFAAWAFFRLGSRQLQKTADELQTESRRIHEATERLRAMVRTQTRALERAEVIKDVNWVDDDPISYTYVYTGSGGIQTGGSAHTAFRPAAQGGPDAPQDC